MHQDIPCPEQKFWAKVLSISSEQKFWVEKRGSLLLLNWGSPFAICVQVIMQRLQTHNEIILPSVMTMMVSTNKWHTKDFHMNPNDRLSWKSCTLTEKEITVSRDSFHGCSRYTLSFFLLPKRKPPFSLSLCLSSMLCLWDSMSSSLERRWPQK